MSEKNLDFDTVINRKNTKSLKYDFAAQRGKPEQVLPMWVADMDFKTSSYVVEALTQMSLYGIYGYSETNGEYFEAVKNWMKKRHDWDVEEEWMIKTPGIVFALAAAVRAYTQEGDAVLIQQPVYYPFSQVVVDNRRKLVRNDLKQSTDGKYEIDFDDFEEKIVRENVKLFILCSPHNPVGRVWTREELTRLGDICIRHGVIVVSDEIHSDFVFQGEHTVFSNVKKEYEKNSIVCTSPSKSFNIAGLQVSNIFIANTNLRKKFIEQIDATGYSQINLAGIIACEAAYKYGEQWLDAVLTYIKANAEYAKAFIEEKLPKVKVTNLEGTYLLWLDFGAYGLSTKELNEQILKKANLWLDGGEMFGKSGAGFQRMNIACPRSVLKTALEQLAEAFEL